MFVTAAPSGEQINIWQSLDHYFFAFKAIGQTLSEKEISVKMFPKNGNNDIIKFLKPPNEQ